MSEEILKYKKRNWLKLKANLYEIGKRNGYYQDVIFYKGKDFIKFGCHVDIAKELEKHKLSTKFNLWFTTTSKMYNEKWYTNNTLLHVELYVPREKQIIQEHEIKTGINKMFEDKYREDYE
jgi:hypothetical protein